MAGVNPLTDPKNKIFACKYQVQSFIIYKNDEKIMLDHTNILSIEYLNDYEFHLMALLKVSIRIDIRKRLWILKNKESIKIKIEVNKIGMDSNGSEYITTPEYLWNLEMIPHFNDEDESVDLSVLEQRLDINESAEFQTSNIEDENYFESQNIMDLYLFNEELLKGSRYTINNVYTSDTLQNIIAHILTESKHKNVLMSKLDNTYSYQELVIPANPVYKAITYLDQYFGLYRTGAMLYYDIDCLYILNSNGKVTAKRENEWTDTTIMVTPIDQSVPGDGMLRTPADKIFYVITTDGNVSAQKFSDGLNDSLGSEAKIVLTDGTSIELAQSDQTYIGQRNQVITYTKSYNNYTADILKRRMEENDMMMYISGNNFDISAFTPNKEFKLVFNDTTKQEKYGFNKYRIAYSYHYLKITSEGYMSSSHRVMLKKSYSIK